MKNFFSLESPFINFLNNIVDLIWLNILTLICCIPVFTAGASITSMYYVTLKMVRGEQCYITKSFFKAFKENFVQATLIGVIMSIVAIGLFIDFYLLKIGIFPSSKVSDIILMVVTVFYLIIYSYVFAILARYHNTLINTLVNSFMLAISNFPKTIILFILNGALLAGLYFFTWLFLVAVLIGFSFTAYLASFILRNIFDKLEISE